MFHTRLISIKSLLAATLFFTQCSTIPAQEISLADHYLDTAHFIVAGTASLLFNSTAINNSFATAFFNGKAIGQENKHNISGKLTSVNRAGGDVCNGMFISFRTDSILGHRPYHLQFFMGYHERQHFDARFNPDFFTLAFYGNKPFAGDTARLDDVDIRYFNYRQFQFGWLKNNGMGKHYAAGISVLNGIKDISIQTGKAYLYTSDIGDLIELYADARFNQSDTAENGGSKGWGLSADLMYEINYNTSASGKGAGFLRLEVNDIGFIRWNDQSFNYTIDTTFTYSGIYIQNIFDLNDSLFSHTMDSLSDSFTSHKATGAYLRPLPPLFRMTVGQTNGKRVFTAGIWYKHQANYTPYIYFSEGFELQKWLKISGRIAYGGYGNLSGGLETVFRLSGFELRCGSSNIDGMLFPDSRSGINAYAILSKQF